MTPEQKARRLAEMVAQAWRSSYHDTSRLDIPLGVIATMTLVRLSDPRAARAVTAWTSPDLDDAELIDTMYSHWSLLWHRQPYLVEMARPLHGWLQEGTLHRDTVAAVRRVVKVALRYGISDLTGDARPEFRSDADVLGAVLTELRAPGDRKHHGEFHTPAAVSEAIARKLGELLPAGAKILEPAAGSGGMIRAGAQQIRALGGDPADYLWMLSDIDRYATACCAVNAILWGLGAQVYIYCGDALAHPDSGFAAAAQMRREVIGHRDRTLTAAMDEHERHSWFLRAVNTVEQLVNAAATHPRPPTDKTKAA
ncbi:N-6 DNA methylase [Nocardia tengchongensis]|uniref:N-6 DNA methylase n=1 Tax=Nocardia tengchongensis TaxID=2055889 RepID=UPI0036551A95